MSVTEQSGVSTLIGTPKEARASLSRSHADRVLVVSFDQVNLSVFEVLAENFANVASSMYEVLQERQDPKSLERLAEVFVTRKPPSPRLLKEAAMLVQARKAVLESGDWLTAADIAQVAQLSTRNPSAQPNKWKKQGQIFAISHGGVDYFPGYGLDRTRAIGRSRRWPKSLRLSLARRTAGGWLTGFAPIIVFWAAKDLRTCWHRRLIG